MRISFIQKIIDKTRGKNKKKYLSKTKTELLIFDDVFPHKLSPFRYSEYNAYLEHFENILIASTGASLGWFNEEKSIDEIIDDFIKEKPQYKNIVSVFDPDTKYEAKLIYVNFLRNAVHFNLTDLKTPFIVNLYPGGGFEVNNDNIDKHLREIFKNKYFKKVIVTQKITYDYLVNNKFCPKNKIEFVFGVVTPDEVLKIEIADKKRFGFEKNTLDICFVAYKYSPLGSDKGYDKFIETACNLIKKYDNINFHVVGSFDENVIDVVEFGDRIKFYGLQKTDWFKHFYEDKDLIISPNVPFILSPGAFDGFPTACVTEAGLNEVAMFSADVLGLNEGRFINDEEIVIIEHDTKSIEEKIEYYYNFPEKLKQLSINGAKKIKSLYSYEKQIRQRINIMESVLRK